jgi:hypothetical protein
MHDDYSLLQKAIIDSLPEGWKMKDDFRVDSGGIVGDRIEISPDVTQYTCRYVANPTTLMVEEGPRETRFAEGVFAGKVLFPTKQPEELREGLRYPGKNPPPSVEELMKGKTFVAVTRNHMFFRMKAEIRRSGELAECVIIESPQPTALQDKNLSIYPLYQAKPETYLHGSIDDSMGIDPTRLLSHLVEETVAKREAELRADEVDVKKERERIAAIQRLQAYGTSR